MRMMMMSKQKNTRVSHYNATDLINNLNHFKSKPNLSDGVLGFWGLFEKSIF